MGLSALFRKSDTKVAEEYFEGKVVWVTGASSGLGEALCMTLCRVARPKALILSARRKTELERVQMQCLEIRPELKVRIVQLDLEDVDALPPLAEKALGMYGQIDVLFNNGGLGFRDLAANSSINEDRKLMNVNFMSSVALVKALLPSWFERGSGHVVQISSVQGFFGLPGRTAYAASKHACQGFFDSLRAEVEDSGVSVTSVCPGYIRTSFGNNAAKGKGEKYPDGHTDQGVAPEVISLEILGAVGRKSKELVSSALNAKLARLARHICPDVLFAYMRRRARKERMLASKDK